MNTTPSKSVVKTQQPTMVLRILRPFHDDTIRSGSDLSKLSVSPKPPDRLQQKWIDISSGEVEWKDVPIVNE